MSMFKKVMGIDASSTTVGNESENQQGSSMVHTAAVAVAMADMFETANVMETVEVEVAVVSDMMGRVENALAQIESASVGFGAKPALSNESLAMLNATLLEDLGVHATGLEATSTFGPVEATREVVLGCEASMGSMWKSFKDTMLKFLDWIMTQFNKVFGTYERMKKRAEALKEKEAKWEGSLSTDQVGVKTKALFVGVNGVNSGTMVTAANLAGEIKKLANVADKGVSDLENAAYAAVEACENALDSGSKADFGITEGTTETNTDKAGGNTQVAGESEGTIAVPTSVSDKFTPFLAAVKELKGKFIGGVDFKEIEGDVAPADYSKARVELQVAKTEPDNKDVKGLDRGQIAAVAEEIIGACEQLISGRKKIKDTSSFKARFNKAMDNAEKKSKDSDFKSASRSVNLVGKIAVHTGLIANGSVRVRINAKLISAMDASLSWAEKSLRKA